MLKFHISRLRLATFLLYIGVGGTIINIVLGGLLSDRPLGMLASAFLLAPAMFAMREPNRLIRRLGIILLLPFFAVLGWGILGALVFAALLFLVIRNRRSEEAPPNDYFVMLPLEERLLRIRALEPLFDFIDAVPWEEGKRRHAARTSTRRAPRHGVSYTPGIQVYGVAGGHIAGASATFGSTAANLGSKGEIAVGALLERLAREYPFLLVFHGLRFTPGRDGADVDHAVALGSELIFIDAKWWAYGNYTWGLGDNLLRDGQPFSGGDIHIGNAAYSWYVHLGYVPQSHIVLAQPNSSRYAVDNHGAPNRIRVDTLDSLESYLRARCRAHTDGIDPQLAEVVLRDLQR